MCAQCSHRSCARPAHLLQTHIKYSAGSSRAHYLAPPPTASRTLLLSEDAWKITPPPLLLFSASFILSHLFLNLFIFTSLHFLCLYPLWMRKGWIVSKCTGPLICCINCWTGAETCGSVCFEWVSGVCSCPSKCKDWKVIVVVTVLKKCFCSFGLHIEKYHHHT